MKNSLQKNSCWWKVLQVKKEKERMKSYITVRKNTTGEANIIPAQMKLICVATDTGRYYPVSLLDYQG
jgi:hypothetical protein